MNMPGAKLKIKSSFSSPALKILEFIKTVIQIRGIPGSKEAGQMIHKKGKPME